MRPARKLKSPTCHASHSGEKNVKKRAALEQLHYKAEAVQEAQPQKTLQCGSQQLHHSSRGHSSGEVGVEQATQQRATEQQLNSRACQDRRHHGQGHFTKTGALVSSRSLSREVANEEEKLRDEQQSSKPELQLWTGQAPPPAEAFSRGLVPCVRKKLW